MEVKVGSIVGNWLVVSDKYKEGSIFWNDCKCICGETKPVRNWHLTHTKTMGCGCSNIKGRFKAMCIGELSLSYYNQIKKGRVLKGKKFSDNVTMEYLWELFVKQNKKCALSGIDIYLNPRWSQQNKGKSINVIQSASLDRIDNTKGYEIGNVQWVHKDINLMKGSMIERDFINFCKLVASNTPDIIGHVDISPYSKWYNSKQTH